MSRLPMHVGPAWPPALSAYDHMSTYAKSDWAWEALRRSPLYQDDTAARQPGDHALTVLANGVSVLRILSGAQSDTRPQTAANA